MSQRKASRESIVSLPFAVTGPRSLLQVREALIKQTDLNPRRRADYISAINAVGRIHLRPGEIDLDHALASIESDPGILLPSIAKIGHVKAGMRKASWANIRSRLRKALRVAGVAVRDGCRQGRLLPVWDEIYRPLPFHPYKSGLGGFVTWCSENGILPTAVNQETLNEYANVLTRSRIRKNARRTLLVTRRTWNKAVLTVPGWPLCKLGVKYNLGHRYTLPLSAFDPRFAEEVIRRRDAVMNPDPLDDAAPSPIRPSTAYPDVYRLRRMASALVVATGRDPKSITTIADLVEVNAAKAILNFLLKRAEAAKPGTKTTANIFLLARFMCGLAEHWCNVPSSQLDKLGGIARKLKPDETGMRPKNRRMLQAFEDEQLVARFLWLPVNVFEETKKKPQLGRLDAVRYAVAFAVGFLTTAPVRPLNAAGTRLDRNILETGSGAARRLRLHYEPREVKNSVDLDFEISGQTLAMYDYYVGRIRPLLTNPDNRYLFPGQDQRGKVASYFSAQIADFLSVELGQRVTAHQFRHLIGYLFLLKNPGNYEVVRQLLGHKNIQTTVKFYAGMSMPQAAKTVDAAITERRSELADLAKRSRRRRRR